MSYIWLNVWPILAGTIAGFAFGAAWYGLLGGPWMRAAGLSRETVARANVVPTAIIGFVAEFWVACILAGALILAPPEAGPWTMAVGSAIVIWLGFVVPTVLVNQRYAMRPIAQTAIDVGHWLGVFLAQVVVMQLWGLVPPAGV